MMDLKDSECDEVFAERILHKIHSLAKKFRFIKKDVTRKHSNIAIRAILNSLKDLGDISERLFRSRGRDVVALSSELESLESFCSKLALRESVTGILEEEEAPNTFDTFQNHIHAEERTWRFQYALWLDKQAAARDLKCSTDQFT